MSDNLVIWDKLQDLLAAGLLSVFGGSAAYVYKSMKEDKGFKLSAFLLNAFLAFFIGNLLGSFLPVGSAYRDGILMMGGFACWPLLGILEIQGGKFFEKFFANKLPE